MIIRRVLRAVIIILISPLALSARADQTSQRTTYGMSLSLQGQLVDLNAPICLPAAGSYSVAYRNSIATGCTGRASDDFATLVFSGGSAATYTMPQSSVTTFTGSISGTTLTTPANAVVIGSVITGTGVLDNTYVTAETNSTTWTVNNSQTVGSRTLTQSVFPPGHGTCFKNNGTALQTLAATTSTIYGAAGVVNGNPAVTGGQVVLYPGGEACLQADTSNNYMVSGFLPGSWYQSAPVGSSVSSFSWTGLSGYPRVRLSCNTMVGVSSAGQVYLQLAYSGVFQATGYSYEGWYLTQGGGSVSPFSNTNDVGFQIGGYLSLNVDNGASFTADLSFAYGTGMGYANEIQVSSGGYADANGELLQYMRGEAPLTTSAAVTGIKIYPSAGTMAGMCWLTPRTGG